MGGLLGYSTGVVNNSYVSAVSEGVIGHWRLDEASWDGSPNQVWDSSPLGYHGTSYGNANTQAGKFGNAGCL